MVGKHERDRRDRIERSARELLASSPEDHIDGVINGATGNVAGITGWSGDETGVADDEHGDMDELTQGLADDDQPLDLAALRADDELLNAIGGIEAQLGDAEPELGSLLLSWRQDVDAEGIAGLVDTDTALHTIFQAKHARQRRRRPRFLVPLASGAAVLVVVFAGMGLAARDAHPGDPLWGLTQVLYSDHARSIQAAADVRTELNHASDALGAGRFATARDELAQAGQAIPSVDNADGQADLQAQAQNLLNQLAASTGGIPPGGTPVDSSAPGGPAGAAPPDSSSSGTDPSQPTTAPTTTEAPPPPPTSTDPPTSSDPPPTSTTADVPPTDGDGDSGSTSSGTTGATDNSSDVVVDPS